MARHGAVDAYDQFFFSEISAATFLEPSFPLTCVSTRVNHQYHVHKNASAIKASISALTKLTPYRTASVFLFAAASVFKSLRLFTANNTHANAPVCAPATSAS